MLVWWTNISSFVGELSDVGAMKPNPFLLENHFTVPLILDMVLYKTNFRQPSIVPWIACRATIVRYLMDGVESDTRRTFCGAFFYVYVLSTDTYAMTTVERVTVITHHGKMYAASDRSWIHRNSLHNMHYVQSTRGNKNVVPRPHKNSVRLWTSLNQNYHSQIRSSTKLPSRINRPRQPSISTFDSTKLKPSRCKTYL
jgi:hypothetical protein